LHFLVNGSFIRCGDKFQMNASVKSLSQAPATVPPFFSPILWGIALLQLVVGAVLVWVAFGVYNIENFGNLGRDVQNFVGTLLLIPFALAAYSAVMLVLQRPGGRYSSMAFLYTAMVACGVWLLTVWGVWDSFEFLTDGIMRQPWPLWGFAIAYSFNWVAGRMRPENPLQNPFQTIGAGIGGLSLVLILWFSGILDGASHALGQYANFGGDAGLASAGVQAWAATVGIAVFGGLAYWMLLRGDAFGETPFDREAWQGWLMLSPNLFGFTVFFAGPLLLSLYTSFTNDTIGNIPTVIGFTNYTQLLALEIKAIDVGQYAQSMLSFGYTPLWEYTWFGINYVVGARDALFWQSLANTLQFCLILVPLSVVPAILLAIILNSDLPGMKFFRAVYFLPSVAAVVGTSLIWRWLYEPTIGFINHGLRQIGYLPAGQNIEWLTNPQLVLFAVVLLAAWQVVGFNTVLFLAGLQGISRELYEAAMIDGANAWNRFFYVTVPLLGPTTFFVIITTVISGLQVFNEPYALFILRPLPTNATTSVFYMYTQGFLETQFGYASAVAWVLFAVIFSITLIQFRLQRRGAY
jgi:ABC-type sugar transport system permease subunit